MILNWKKILGYSFALALVVDFFLLIFSDGPVEYFLNGLPGVNITGFNFSLVPPAIFFLLSLILFLIDKSEKRISRIINSSIFFILSTLFYFFLVFVLVYGWLFLALFLRGNLS